MNTTGFGRLCLLGLVAAALAVACAEGKVEFYDEQGEGAGTTTHVGGSGTGGTAPVDCSALEGTSPECQSCAGASCAQACTACAANPACVALVECLLACPSGGGACIHDCTYQYSGGIQQVQNLSDCITAECDAECDGVYLDLGNPCGMDCSQIETDDCHEAVCDDASGNCVVQNASNGTACEDGEFCTINDACTDGVCEGGPPNDCDLTPPPCQEVVCQEASQDCTTVPLPNGDYCIPESLCEVNGSCTNGTCVGQPKDCTYAPKPDPQECFNSACDPQTGTCEPEPGNDGDACEDLADLCTVDKTCSAGACTGGTPMDCSQLTVGCFNGVCDTNNGQCFQDPVPPGGNCAEATDQCNQGICDAGGNCLPTPINNGDPCTDPDPCTDGETCQSGSCTGGQPVTQCIDGDSCCPNSCTELNDDDCSCGVNLATTGTPSASSGGTGGYGPDNYNDGQIESYCQANSCPQYCFGWISNGTTPGGAYIQYDWPQQVTIGSFYVETENASNPVCGPSGRNIASGVVQWWDGNGWQTATTFSGETDDVQININPKVITNKLRIFDMTTSPGNGNSIIYEWYVYAGANCSP